MAQTPTGGWGNYVNWGFESSFGAGAVSARTFGQGVKLSIDRSNNLERIYSVGSRNASATVAKKYEGSATAEFILSNATFLRAVLGAVADAGAGPYTHTYTEANTLPSFAIDTGAELGTTDEVVELKGCIVKTCMISAVVDEVVRVKLDLLYNNETLATSGIGSQVAETFEPFMFAQGFLEIPDGTTLAYIQNFELTIDNSVEFIWGLGSRFATAQVAKQRAYNFRMTVVASDPQIYLQTFYGASGGPHTSTPAAKATLVLNFTNGLTSTNERSIIMTFANAYYETHGQVKDINEVYKEEVVGHALSCTSIVWTNNTAADNATP